MKLRNIKKTASRIALYLAISSASFSAINATHAQSVDNAALINQKTIDTLKTQLLNNKDFADQIKKTLGSSQLDASQVQTIMKDYLLKNPEIMLEVQSALMDKRQHKIAENQSQVIQELKKEIFHSADDAVLGNPKGNVTIVEFFDYNCGHCRTTLPELKSLLQHNPNVRLVIKDLPIFGKESMDAHTVAHAFYMLMPAKYQQFHEKMLSAQGKLNGETALAIATSMGANKKALQAKMQDPALKKTLIANNKIASALNIDGTPSFVIGHEVIPGAVSEKAFAEKIRQISQ